MVVAGSLNNAYLHGLKERVDTTIRVESYGSARGARLVASGKKNPDIVSLADTALFSSPLHPDWYAVFATNALVVAYNTETEGGRQIGAAGRDAWYRPLLEGDVTLGRTDPNLDPLGYRTLFMLELATSYYDTDVDLRRAIPRRDQIYPETQLVSQFETGAIDAAITYRNMAEERSYEYIELPPNIDLSDPAFTSTYSEATYDLPDGTTVSGDLIRYGSTVREETPTVIDIFDTQLAADYLREFGFTVPDAYPRFTGEVPDSVRK